MGAPTQITQQQTVDIFKKNFGGINNLVPVSPSLIGKLLPFSAKEMVGDAFVEAAILAYENGLTLGGDAQDVVSINEAVAGAVKQSSIKPSQTIINSVVSWGFLSRSAKAGEEAFVKGFAHVTKRNLDSHNHYLDLMKVHGQRASLMGYVSFDAAGTAYRGTTFSGSGSITLTRGDGTTIAFVNGVNVAPGIGGALGAILVRKGFFAASIWTAKTAAPILQVNSTGTIVAQGAIVKSDASLGIVYVDFVPVAASSQTSHRLCFMGQERAQEMVGMQKILTNTGTLFGIDAAKYELWQANQLNLGGRSFSLRAVQAGVAATMSQGGLGESDSLDILVNPLQFGRMLSDEAAFRKYDASYSKDAKTGFETIEFYAPNGANRIFGTPIVMEGEAYGVLRDTWICSGSQAPAFKVVGMDGQEIIQPLPNQTGFAIRSYGDEYVFCEEPAKNIYWSGLDADAAQF